MQLQINDTWRITTDPRNYILQSLTDVEVRDAETRKPTGETKQEWRDVGYYGDVAAVLKRVLNEEIRDQDKADVRELIDTVREIEKKFDTIAIK